MKCFLMLILVEDAIVCPCHSSYLFLWKGSKNILVILGDLVPAVTKNICSFFEFHTVAHNWEYREGIVISGSINLLIVKEHWFVLKSWKIWSPTALEANEK